MEIEIISISYFIIAFIIILIKQSVDMHSFKHPKMKLIAKITKKK